MGSTSQNKDIATTKSNHGCVTPPEMSLAPPTPPAGPVPMPFVYTARSSTAERTAPALKASGAPVLVHGKTPSVMEVDLPANKACDPVKAAGGGDVITHAICGVAVTQAGSSGTFSGGAEVCRTGDSVRTAVITKSQQVCQATVPLLRAGDFDATTAEGGKNAGNEKKVKAALAAQQSKKAHKGKVGHAPDLVSDPVHVVSGQVMDKAVDISLPGIIPLTWWRSYASGRNGERTQLGRGGWTHGLEQWIVEEKDLLTLRWVDGSEVYFPRIGPGESTFHRRERLTLTRDRRGFVVFQHGVRRMRMFEPLERGGRAMLRSVRDSYGHAIELSYESGRLQKITDTAGRELRVLSDERGRVARLEVWATKPAPRPPFPPPNSPPPLELVQWVDYAYHPEGELASVTDASGHVEAYAYDGYHRMVKKTLRSGVTFRYEYDDDLGGFCVRAWGDGGLHAVHLTPDPKRRTTLLAGSHEPRRYTWNADGMVIREETPDGSFVRERVFDDDLYLLEESNASGEKTTYKYDERGNCIKKVDPAGNETSWQYQGDLVVKQVSPGGLVTTFAYDPHRALSAVAFPTGVTITLSRDAHGRLTGIQGPDGLAVGYAYDEHHNRAEIVSARGGQTIAMFDALGRVVARYDAIGRMTRFEYDALGRAITAYAPDGSVRRASYDPLGQVREVVDAAGRVTTFEHAGTSVRVAAALPNGQRWAFEHDDDERLVKVKNPRFELYELEYDAAGRVERERTFDGRVLGYRYSMAGRLARIDYPDRTWRELSYDPLGNLVVDRSPHGTITFERDGLGRILKATVDEPTGQIVTEFERDRFSRVVAERQGEHELRFTYDDRGRRTTRVLPNGQTTKYYHDTYGGLSALDHDGYKLALERDLLGRVTRTHLYDGKVDIQYAYDPLGRVASQRVVGGAEPAVIVQRAYATDDHGRPVRIDDDRWGTVSYRYDAAGNLIEARLGALAQVFDHDAAGALVGSSDPRAPVPTEPWTTAPGDRVTRAGSTRYAYDARGRRVRKVEVEPGSRVELVTEYEWDCRDRLREVYLPDGRRVRFTYDAFGRRVKKQTLSRERADFAGMVRLALERGDEALPKPHVVEFLWDGHDLCTEIENGDYARVFVHERLSHVPLLQRESDATFAYVTDSLGVPRELVDRDGRVAWKAQCSPFGAVMTTWKDPKAQRETSSPFRLLGQYADADLGLCYALFRYFDPAIGRWCSPDPLGFVGGPHLFGFNGAPTATADPFGLANLCAPSRSRADALADARERAGLPRDATPGEVFEVTPTPLNWGTPWFKPGMKPTDIVSALGGIGRYEVHEVPDPHSPTGKTSVAIVEHPSDPNNPPHFHAVGPDPHSPHSKDPANFPYRTERYAELPTPTGEDPHIFYSP